MAIPKLASYYATIFEKRMLVLLQMTLTIDLVRPCQIQALQLSYSLKMQFYNTGRRLAPTLDVSQSEIKLEADYFDYVKDPSSFQIRSGSEIFVSISEVESAADDLKTSPLRLDSEKCKKASHS